MALFSRRTLQRILNENDLLRTQKQIQNVSGSSRNTSLRKQAACIQ